MKKLKGSRTLVVNALMVAAGVAGTELTPELADEYAGAFIVVWGLINAALRWVTSTPIFKKE